MRVIKYRATWSPKSRNGSIEILLEDSTRKSLPFSQASEFNTCLLILQGGDDDCYYLDGSLSTGIDDI